ncbi:MAG: hypothetical protein PHI32_05375 [Dysgonamonadaceae bacterium]|nr:hypothetical protein [Dysgonamonadaceae bacterium]
MSKLYVFGIGGTGARVLKSLTMLLAAGIECGVDTIVPIIIDRDLSNKDLSRTKLLIDNYIEVNKIAETKKGFFNTKINLLNNELFLQLNDNTQKFDDFIGRSTMSKENQALMDMLFSKETLNLDMAAGFQGNPNIGSVVLNQFDDNDVFKAFANDFQDGDKIFIISSIFGGTGASGFPLLRKTLHAENVKDASGMVLPKWGLINKAPIGAITVLPYFNVDSAPEDSLVNSDTFIDKSRAALSYYKTEDRKLDTLYYIADKTTSTYEHNKGGDAQKNDAHFVELAAALSLLDFVDPKKQENNIHRDDDKNILRTTYKEFGINDNNGVVDFTSLADETKSLIVNPLSRFMLFRNYMIYVFDKEYKVQPYTYKRFRGKFRNKHLIQKLETVQSEFHEWMEEMQKQKRNFTPFKLSSDNAFDFIKGDLYMNTPKDVRYKDWAVVDNELNRQLKNTNSEVDEARFIELFNLATEELLNFKN